MRSPGVHNSAHASCGIASPSGCAGATSTTSTSTVTVGEGHTSGTFGQPSSDDHVGEAGLPATGRQTHVIDHLIIAAPINPHPMTTWVKRGFRLPTDKLMLLTISSSPLSPVPTSIRIALIDPSWRCAMEEEYDTFITNNTWDIIPRPIGSNVVTSKWIFKHKFNSDGTLERYKAHWVLHDFTQRPGVDYDETFSPVV
jgi:hypothetical protein